MDRSQLLQLLTLKQLGHAWNGMLLEVQGLRSDVAQEHAALSRRVSIPRSQTDHVISRMRDIRSIGTRNWCMSTEKTSRMTWQVYAVERFDNLLNPRREDVGRDSKGGETKWSTDENLRSERSESDVSLRCVTEVNSWGPSPGLS